MYGNLIDAYILYDFSVVPCGDRSLALWPGHVTFAAVKIRAAYVKAPDI
jgi:hypothetical protein